MGCSRREVLELANTRITYLSPRRSSVALTSICLCPDVFFRKYVGSAADLLLAQSLV